MPKRLTKRITDFRASINPNPFGDGFVTLEHFDTITGQARPFRTTVASQNNTGQTTATMALLKFASVSGSLYALGKDASDTSMLAVYKWDQNQFDWRDKASSNAAASPLACFFEHKGNLYGLRDNTHLWKMTLPNTYNGSFLNLTSFTYFADGFVHSKDGCAYFAVDNKVVRIDTADSPAVALTLPNANFVITSLCEQGDFINIVGYDKNTGMSASLLWDRDTSVTDITSLYSLGPEVAYHNANLGGTTFIVQLRSDTSNTSWDERKVIVIKYIYGDKAKTLLELPVESLTITNGRIGGKHITHDRLYFNALVKMVGESAASHKCFALDQDGRLSIAARVPLNAGSNPMQGVFRDGEGFWFAGDTAGSWNTSTAYTDASIIETTKVRSEDLAKEIGLVGAIISTEPLPADGQVVLQARTDETTAWTTIATQATDDAIKLTVSAMKARNALPALASAREIQFRIESTGAAVITGFQYAVEETDTENYG